MNKIQKAIKRPGDVLPYLVGRFRYTVDEPYIRPIDRKIGNFALRSPVESQKYLFGKLAIKRSQLRSDLESTDNELSDELRDQGYLSLGQPFDTKLIEKIREKYNEVITDPELTRVRGEADGKIYARGVKRDLLFELIPELKELINDDIQKVVKGYYGSHFKILRASFYRTSHVPPEVAKDTEVYNDYWHVDGRTTDHLKLFVLFSDTTERDGPMHVLSKEESKRIVKMNNGFDRREDGIPGEFIEQNARDIERFTGQPGSVMIANTQKILHRAGHPEPGRDRDLLMFYLAPSSTPLPDDWDEEEIAPSNGRLTRLLSY